MNLRLRFRCVGFARLDRVRRCFHHGRPRCRRRTGAAPRLAAREALNRGRRDTGVGGSSNGASGSSVVPAVRTMGRADGSGMGGSNSGAGGGSAGMSGGTGGRAGTAAPTGAHAMAPGSASPWWHRAAARAEHPTVSAFVGVNTKRVQDFHSQQCPNPVVCPAIACPVAPPNPGIAARCVAGKCQAFDVTKVPEFSACGPDNACELRAGLGCCICGAANSGWVAVSRTGEQAIAAAECAPNTACLDCLPVPPPRTLASCTNHVCQVLLAP